MFESKFFGKEPVKKPECPFCGSLIERPKELSTRRAGEMPVGSCSCGAVYACDETGHNLGAAMIEALVFGCNMDWDLAWSLDPDEDYQNELVEQYDLESHLIIPSGNYEGRRIAGALYFVRLHQDVREVTAEGVVGSLRKARPRTPEPPKKRDRNAKRLSKKEVEYLIQQNDISALVDAGSEDKKVIRYIQRLLYSGDTLFRHRVAAALGRVCAAVAENDSGIVSKLLQGLFYSLSDTAAFPVGAFEAIGEIISHRPDLFGGYTPQLYQFVADKTKKAQTIQTLARIAKSSPELLRRHTFHFFPFLEDPDLSVRGYAAWLMGNLRAHEAEKDLEKLKEETHEIQIYENDRIETRTVGQVAQEALSRL